MSVRHGFNENYELNLWVEVLIWHASSTKAHNPLGAVEFELKRT